MIRKYAATAVLLLALAGCSSSHPAAPSAPAPAPSPTGTAACEQALVDAYHQHQAGADTGDMPKPAACAGIAGDVYLQLAFQAMAGGASPTGS
jgi:hypothetical protein